MFEVVVMMMMMMLVSFQVRPVRIFTRHCRRRVRIRVRIVVLARRLRHAADSRVWGELKVFPDDYFGTNNGSGMDDGLFANFSVATDERVREFRVVFDDASVKENAVGDGDV